MRKKAKVNVGIAWGSKGRKRRNPKWQREQDEVNVIEKWETFKMEKCTEALCFNGLAKYL